MTWKTACPAGVAAIQLVGMALAGTALAGQPPSYQASRPVVVPVGSGRLDLDATLCFWSSAPAWHAAVDSGYRADRYGGVALSYGVADRLELGLALVPYTYREDRVGGAPKVSAFGGGSIWVRWAFIDQLALEVGVGATPATPSEDPRDQKAGVRVALPVVWILSPGLLAFHARPDLVTGFAADTFNGGSVLLKFDFDAGFLLSLANAYLDVTAGVAVQAWPRDPGPTGREDPLHPTRPAATFGLKLGWNFPEGWDLFAAFQFDNLTPATGGRTDQTNLTVGTSYRF